jgi:hypothetical protein
MTDDPVKQALAELSDLVRCRCHEAYRDRGLQDPQCMCDSADAVKVVTDRIEELERDRDDLQELNRENMRQWAAAIDRAEAAEAEIARLKTPEGAAGVLLDWWENVDQDDPTLEAAIDVALIMGDTQEEVDRWHNALRSLSQGGPK